MAKSSLPMDIDPKTMKKRPKPVKMKGKDKDPYAEGQASSITVKKAKGGMVKKSRKGC